jgi:zinc finger protein
MEFVPFSSKKRLVVKFPINNKLDLDAKVIKSQSCIFKIPELNLEVEPGPESQAEIINVNGVLSNITLALEYEYGSNKLSNAIKKIKEGKSKVTLILEDPIGASTVIPRKLRKT